MGGLNNLFKKIGSFFKSPDEKSETSNVSDVASEEVASHTEPIIFHSVATGTVIDLDQVADEVFSSKMMGDGFAVQPTDQTIVSPVDATVLSIFPTKHAMGLQTKEGLELLIHMGLDTVELNGEGFEVLINEGDNITAGQPIATMDIDVIKNNGKGTDIIVIATNMDKVDSINIETDKEVTKGETVGEFVLK